MNENNKNFGNDNTEKNLNNGSLSAADDNILNSGVDCSESIEGNTNATETSEGSNENNTTQNKNFEDIYDGLLYEQYGATCQPSFAQNGKFSEYNNAAFNDVIKPSKSSGFGRFFHLNRPLTKRSMGFIIAACMLFSMLCGFGGGLLANNIGGTTKVVYSTVAKAASTGSTTSSSALSIEEIASLASNSVVAIVTEQVATSSRLQQYVSQGAGSGIIVSSDGYIATNYHVIEGASKIKVTLNGSNTSYDATVVGYDSKTDIAVIKIKASNLTPVVFGDSDSLQVGDTAVAIGNPLGTLGGTVTNGIISALNREITIDGQTMNLLQTNAAINPGNSGGGLFNSSGQLIGITNAKSSGTGIEGLGFAIPINIAKPIIEELISNGYVQGRVSLGISVVDVTDLQTALMYRVQRLGVYVQSVANGSDAQNAGFNVGDCIISVNGTQISSASDIKAIIDKSSVGDKLTIVVIRSGKQVTLNVTLTQYVPSN